MPLQTRAPALFPEAAGSPAGSGGRGAVVWGGGVAGVLGGGVGGGGGGGGWAGWGGRGRGGWCGRGRSCCRCRRRGEGLRSGLGSLRGRRCCRRDGQGRGSAGPGGKGQGV